MEYTCPHCGAPIGANTTKCEYCGNSIPNNVSEIVNNSIKIGDYNSIVNSIIGNNNKVVIDSDQRIGSDRHNEDNWFDRVCTVIMRTVIVWIFAYILYRIGFVL